MLDCLFNFNQQPEIWLLTYTNMPYLRRQITSHCNRKVYGEQNEEVTIICQSGHVVIVEGRGRFPMLMADLSDVEIHVEEIKPQKDEWQLF